MRYSGNRVGTNTSMDEEFQDSFGQVFPDSGSSPNFFEVVGHGSGPEAARLQGCPYSIGPVLDVIHMWHTAEWGHLMTMGSLHLHYKICCAALPKYILKVETVLPSSACCGPGSSAKVTKPCTLQFSKLQNRDEELSPGQSHHTL